MFLPLYNSFKFLRFVHKGKARKNPLIYSRGSSVVDDLDRKSEEWDEQEMADAFSKSQYVLELR